MRNEMIQLKKEMKKQGIAMYLVPTGDEHRSEYVPEFYKFRAYLSGFTGSAGTLLVTDEECLLWTDGRYFIQAEKQLQNSGIVLMKSGEKGVPTLEEYVSLHVKEGDVIGVNMALISCSFGKELAEIVEKQQARLEDVDFANLVWKNRPAMQVSKVERLGPFYTGRRVQEKLEMVRESMKKEGADVHVISSLDDIAWLYNLRGKDIPYNPVFYAYTVIEPDRALLFAKPYAIDENLMETLQDEKIEVLEYDDFYEYIEKNIADKQVLLDSTRCNYRIYDLLGTKNEIIEKENPTVLMKSIKTAVESHNISVAHQQDGLIMIKFIYWIKKQIADGVAVTEYEAAEYLDKLRLAGRECVDLSFDTIAAYGPNAAMCHYSPSENDSAKIEPEGFLLVDSGGQYLKGTTDITRTIAVGPLTKKQKEHYTLVLQGHIRMSMARFPEGVCGANLDILARGPLWSKGLDFNHGTGHGVGYYLNVHEGPNNIHWNLQRKTAKTIPLQPGMLTSNEPGLYLEGQYGIRIENLLLTKKVEEFGIKGFLEFETVTRAPYERDAILPEFLSDEELNWLNEYHRQLFEVYSKNLTEEERVWFRGVTEPLLKAEKECYNQTNTQDME